MAALGFTSSTKTLVMINVHNLKDGKVHIYALNGSSLEEIKSVTQSGSITSVTWSPNGNFLVATDTSRKVNWISFRLRFFAVDISKLYLFS